MTENHEQPCKDILEIKAEWKQIKNRTMYLLLGSWVMIVGYGIWVGNVQTNTDHIKIKLVEHSAQINTLTQNESSSRAQLAGIEAQLRSIDTSLQEIKHKLQ